MPDPVQEAEALHGKWRRHGAKSAQGAVIPAFGEGGQKKKKKGKKQPQRTKNLSPNVHFYESVCLFCNTNKQRKITAVACGGEHASGSVWEVHLRSPTCTDAE